MDRARPRAHRRQAPTPLISPSADVAGEGARGRARSQNDTPPLNPAQPTPAAVRLKPTMLLALQAFDAAIRLGSFKAAAAALHLTPSAVSHRIGSLERALGEALFARTHRAIRPTAAGSALAAGTGRAFAELARAASPAEGLAGHRRLRLGVLPFFASAWLIPRVAHFMAAHPDIELVIETASRHVDLDTEAFDAAVRVGEGEWPDLISMRLMEIRATPVATAALVRQLKLRQPADLARAALIHVTTFPLAWPTWLEKAGVAGLKPQHAIWVDGFGAALQVAEQGGGVALGLEPLFTDRERRGALCRPLPISQPTGGYWLVHRKNDASHRGLRAFKRWLLTEIAADG